MLFKGPYKGQKKRRNGANELIPDSLWTRSSESPV